MDKEISKINYKKDVIVNTIAQVLYLAVLWIMTVITPRIGTSADAGVFTIALSISNICTTIATYSINFYVASDTNCQYKDRHYLYFGFTSTLVSFLVSIVIALSFGYYNDMVMLWSVILFYLFKCAENITLIISANLQRVGKLYLSGYSLIIKAIFSFLIFTLTLFFSKNIILAFGLIAVFAFLYLFFVDLWLLKKYTNGALKFSKEIYKQSLKLFIVAFPVFLYGICFAAIGSFPRIVLNQSATKEVVGYFGTMAAITAIIQSSVNALLVPFLPKISILYEQNNKKELLKMILFFSLLILIGTSLAFILSLYLDKWLIGILYPGDPIAVDYAHHFRWIILIGGLQALTLFFCLFLIAIRKLKILSISSLIGIVFMFVFSYIFIPVYNISGVIYTNYIAYGGMAIIPIIETIRLVCKKK